MQKHLLANGFFFSSLMDGLKGLVWLSRIAWAELGGVLWDLAGLLGQLSGSRQAPGDSTHVSQAAPIQVRRAEAQEGPGQEKAQGTPSPHTLSRGFSQTWTKSFFRTPVRGAELSRDPRGGTG